MKTVTLTPRGRFLVLSVAPEDRDAEAALRSSPRVQHRASYGGFVADLRDVSGLVADLRSRGLAVRFGSPVREPRPEPPSRRLSAFDRPLPRSAAEGRDTGYSTRFLQDLHFHPSDLFVPEFQRSFVARWRAPGEGLPALEPVDLASLDVGFDVPGFKGTLYPFQRQGVAFLRKLGYSGIVADEMGLGKTVEAIAAALLVGERTLVVCPAAVKYNWVAEIGRFTDRGARALEGHRYEGPADAFFTVVNYDLVPRHLERLNAEKFGLVVLDEAHYVKNPHARRSQAVYRLDAPRRILLTGTPLLNRPQELYPLLHFTQPGKWGTPRDFHYLYCRKPTRLGPGGLVVMGAAGGQLRDLRERLRGVMIRRQKETVLRDLPAKTIEVQPVELDAQAAPAYKALEGELAEYLAAEGLEAAFAGQGWMRTLARMHQLKQFTIAARLPQVKEWLSRRASEGEKVVVFSQYLAPLHELHRDFSSSSVLVDGSVASAERLRLADEFQARKDLSFCIGQIQALGTGLNLTGARLVLFLDLAWTPAAHAQAMDRCHRIGQTRPVVVTFLVTPGTIDEHLQRILLEKQAVINTVMGERQQLLTETQVMRRVAEEILRARA